MRRTLRTTTALVAALAIGTPTTIPAQEAASPEPATCPDGTAPPCPPEAVEAEAEGEAEVEAEGEAEVEEAAPEAEAEAEEQIETEAEADAAAPAEGSAPAEGDAPADAAAPAGGADAAGNESAPAGDATTEEAADSAEDEAPVEETADEAVAPDASETDMATEEAVPAEAEVTADDGAEAEIGGPDIVDVLEDGAEIEGASAPAESDSVSSGDETAETAEPAAEDATVEAGAAEGEPEAESQTEAQEATEAETEADAEVHAEGEGEPSDDAASEIDAAALQQSLEAEMATAAAVAETAESAAAADAPEESEEAEVSEVTVTEETSRSSDEDFDSRLSALESAQPQATAADDDGDRNRDRLVSGILGALGGVVVGQMLSGNREVVATADDRVVVRRGDQFQVLKDDNALLAQPGSTVRTETFDDGSTRTTVLREDGSRIVTIRDADLRVLRRVRITPDGERIMLIDDTAGFEPVDVSTLPAPRPQSDVRMLSNEDALRRALEDQQRLERTFSLSQVREISAVRQLAPAIDLDSVTFASGSAAIEPSEAEELTTLGRTIANMIDDNPREIFLVEGHTDAIGDAAFNLALSDRRAESVALALTEYFDIPPENLVVQGYGERYLRIPTQEAERQNRRATMRRITDLLQTASAN